MKNVTSIKSNNINSPKTPGGISKSLLTPCRRLGLSRNWRKSGPSPFISPLSGSSTPTIEEKKETRKRKEPVPEDNTEENTDNVVDEKLGTSIGNDKTPSRNVVAPRRKKSKTLISTINKSQSEENNENVGVPLVEESSNIGSSHDENTEVVSTPVRTKSKKSKHYTSPLKTSPRNIGIANKCEPDKPNEPPLEQITKEEPIYSIKEKSPNDLRKECVVVIQKKIFKNIKPNDDNKDRETCKTKIKGSKYDSDSDEAPLINLNKTNSIAIANDDNEDDDFIAKTSKVKPSKLSTKAPKNNVKTQVEKQQKLSSQDCFDDDDDDFDNKKTILVKKTYEKVSKPIKAKSTGSITQRDIDNLKKRIEAKKKLLLAQSITPDTEELRSLIKKWQKGCQDALMELLDLMRNKFPDKERMDYSEMLLTLKIPPSLVGYDSENDCFNSPDDASIILGQLKDL